MTQTTWATAADVLDLTGQTVTSQQVSAANSVIEVCAARVYTLAIDRTGSRDVEWMRRAVAYQTVWMTSQPDFFQRMDVTSIAEGRKSVGLKDSALILAPMAAKTLKRVSWLRSRSIHVRSAWQDGMTPISPDPTSSGNDFYEQWNPMMGGG